MTITTSALEPTLLPPSAPVSGRDAGLVSWYAESFSDRLGDRLLLFDNRGPGLELLRFHRELGADPAFEAALRARLDALSRFQHPAFVRPRSVTWLDDPHPRLALVSELAEGERLSAVLAAARLAGTRIDRGSAIWLLRELLAALGALHGAAPGMHHGLVTAERVVLGRGGRLSITEYVLGGALEQIEAHGPMPPPSRDVVDAARLAAGVLLGRPAGADSNDLLLEALGGAADDRQMGALRAWFAHAWAADGPGFTSGAAAREALDDLLPDPGVSWSRPSFEPEAPLRLPVRPPAQRSTPDRPALSERALDLEETIAMWVEDIMPQPAAVPTDRAPAWRSQVPGWISHVQRHVAEDPAVRRLWMLCGALALIALTEAICLYVIVPQRVAFPPAPAPAAAPAPAGQPDPGSPADTSTSGSGNVVEPSATPAPVPTARRLPVRTAARAAPGAGIGRVSPAATVAGSEPAVGWIKIDTPFEVRVYANGRLLGSGLSQRYRLPEGRHMITVASDEHGLRSTQPVDVVPRETLIVPIDVTPR